MRVMVADQDIEQRRSLVSYLQSLSHTVQEALTERDILDQCRGKCPHLLFINQTLSGTNAADIIRQIRQIGGHAIWLSIILMTNQFVEQEIRTVLDAGADDYLIKPIPELSVLAKVRSAERYLNLKEEVFTVAHDLVLANRVMENVMTQDVLTGIGNASSFDDSLEKAWFQGKRENQSLTLLMINVDYFQAYNQTYGPTNGDEVIKKIAQALKLAIPSSEASIARLIGATFAVVLPNTNAELGLQIAEKLRMTIDSLNIPHVSSGCSDHVTASIGVSTAEPGVEQFTSPWDLKEAADFALFQAKHFGRNRSYQVSAAESNAH